MLYIERVVVGAGNDPARYTDSVIAGSVIYMDVVIV